MTGVRLCPVCILTRRNLRNLQSMGAIVLGAAGGYIKMPRCTTKKASCASVAHKHFPSSSGLDHLQLTMMPTTGVFLWSRGTYAESSLERITGNV